MSRYIMRAEQINGIYHLIEKNGILKILFDNVQILEICTDGDEEKAKKMFVSLYPNAEKF